jgi:uncharacterized membrane protein
MENSNSNTNRLIYILYLANLLIPFLGLIGVIMAYINKDDAPAWLQSHYQFQIRTFWLSLIFGIIGLILTMIIIGYLILFFTVIWIIIRCAKGMKYLDNQQAHPDPYSWQFG